MRCDQTELLSLYLDGELPAAEADRVREHLVACPPCAAEADAAREVGRLLRTAARAGGPAEPSADVMDRLRVHVRELVGSPDLMLMRMARVFTGLAASVLVGGLLLLQSHPVKPAVQTAAASGEPIAFVSLLASADTVEAGGDAAGGPSATAGSAAGADPSARDARSSRDTVFDRLLGVQEASASVGEAEAP
jgi:anti-sigma factor RsiW